MRFFAFVQKHCGPFLVLGYCYLAALILLSERLGWPDWAQMLLVLPLNAVAWPLAVLVWKDARTPRLICRCSSSWPASDGAQAAPEDRPAFSAPGLRLRPQAGRPGLQLGKAGDLAAVPPQVALLRRRQSLEKLVGRQVLVQQVRQAEIA